MLISLISSVLLFLPFVLYVVVKKKGGWHQGVIAAMIASAIALSVLIFLAPQLWKPICAGILLILVLGGISLKIKHPIYFLLEPTVRAWTMALYLMISRLVRGESLLIELYTSFMENPLVLDALPPEARDAFSDPEKLAVMLEFIDGADVDMSIGMMIYGTVMIWVARRGSDLWWLTGKFLFTPFITAVALLGMLLRRFIFFM